MNAKARYFFASAYLEGFFNVRNPITLFCAFVLTKVLLTWEREEEKNVVSKRLCSELLNVFLTSSNYIFGTFVCRNLMNKM